MSRLTALELVLGCVAAVALIQVGEFLYHRWRGHCPVCLGRGVLDTPWEPVRCSECNGTGKMLRKYGSAGRVK